MVDVEGNITEVEVTLPVIDIFNSGTTDVHVHDLTVSGGRRGIIVRGEAGSAMEDTIRVADPVVLERVSVEESERIGVIVDGAFTVASLLDVSVDDVQAEGGEYGWGIAVQSRAFFADDVPAATVLEGVEVHGAQGVGVLIDAAWVDLSDVTVEDTDPVDGILGRGFQLQSRSWGILDGVVATGNGDAAMHLHKPGREGPEGYTAVTIQDSQLVATALSDVPGNAGEEAAEGLSTSQGAIGGDVEDYVVVLDGVELSGNLRAQLVADGITVALSPNNIFGKGGAYIVVAQGGAVVEGLDGDDLPEVYADQVEVLGAADALELNDDPLELDEMTD